MALPLSPDQIESAHKAGLLDDAQYSKAMAAIGKDLSLKDESPISGSLKALNIAQGKDFIPIQSDPRAIVNAPSRALQQSGDNVDLSQMKSAAPSAAPNYPKTRAMYNGLNNSMLGLPHDIINSYDPEKSDVDDPALDDEWDPSVKQRKLTKEQEKKNDEQTERAAKEHPYISGGAHLASDVALAAMTGGLGEGGVGLGESLADGKTANYLGTGMTKAEYVNSKAMEMIKDRLVTHSTIPTEAIDKLSTSQLLQLHRNETAQQLASGNLSNYLGTGMAKDEYVNSRAMESIKNSLVKNSVVSKEAADKLSTDQLLQLHRSEAAKQLANPHRQELQLARDNMEALNKKPKWQGGPDFENAKTELSPQAQDEIKTNPQGKAHLMANAFIPTDSADTSSLMNISPQQQASTLKLPSSPLLNQVGNPSIAPNTQHFNLPQITMTGPRQSAPPPIAPPAPPSPIQGSVQALNAMQGKGMLPPAPPPSAPDTNVDMSQAGSSDNQPSQVSHPGDLDQSVEGVNPPPAPDSDNNDAPSSNFDMSSLLSGGSAKPKGPSAEQQLMDELTADQTLRGQGTSKEQESLDAQADARAKMEQQKAAAQNTWNDEAQQRQSEIDQDRAISHQSMQQQMANIQSQIDQQSKAQIDPRKWWKDQGTGRSILAAISMGLGAAGSVMSGMNGRHGTPNFAADIIQKKIEEDIDSQKENMAAKWRAIAASSNATDKKYIMEQGMIADKTKAIAEGQMRVKNQIDAITNSGQAQIDPARANELKAQIDQHLADTQDTYAKHMYDVRTVLRAQQNMAGNNPALLYQKYADEGQKARLEAAKTGNDPNKVEILDFPTWYKTRYGGTGIGKWNQAGTSGPDENGVSPELIDTKVPKPLQDQAKEELKKLNDWQSAKDSTDKVSQKIFSTSMFNNPLNVITRNIPGSKTRMSMQDQRAWNAHVQTTMHKINAGSGRNPDQELAFNKPFLIGPDALQADVDMAISSFKKQLQTPPSTPTLRRFGVYQPPAPKVTVDAASLGAKPLE